MTFFAAPFCHPLLDFAEVYTTTVETPFLSLSRSEALWCIPFFSGPMVYTFVPCFPRKMVCTIVLFAL